MATFDWIAPAAAGLGLGGLAAAGIVLWWKGRTVGAGPVEAELRRQLAVSETSLVALRGELAEAREGRVRAETARQAIEAQLEAAAKVAARAEEERRTAMESGSAATASLAAARGEIGRLEALGAERQAAYAVQLRELRERHDAALVELRAAGERQLEALRGQFKALASEALQANNPEFLRLAQEKLAQFQTAAKGDLELRAKGVEALVQPLQEALRGYQARLQQAESQQQAALGEVRQQLERLRTDSQSLAGATQRLREVLNSNQARGRWGEETLRRVVEAAGMSPHCDFTEQVRDGDAKPDMVVHLPGDRVILVDAKTPDIEFLAALQEAGETGRADALRKHAQSVRARVMELSQRDYPGKFANSLDYVVLFVPAESIFSAALEGDPELIIWRRRRRWWRFSAAFP
jgi:DNA recombination protein RmuC